MDVIHFTHGATDPTASGQDHGVRQVYLAAGQGAVHLGCLHLLPGARSSRLTSRYASALLVVHGRIDIRLEDTGLRVTIHAGMGAILTGADACVIESETGAIVLVLAADMLTASASGLSTPLRIGGQRWPSDTLLGGQAGG